MTDKDKSILYVDMLGATSGICHDVLTKLKTKNDIIKKVNNVNSINLITGLEDEVLQNAFRYKITKAKNGH